MKKLSLLLCIVLIFSLLAGCGTQPSSSSSAPSSSTESSSASLPDSGSSSAAPSSTPSSDSSSSFFPPSQNKDYKAIIEAARPAELNELSLYAIVTSPDDDMYDQYFSTYSGFDDSVMSEYALSIGTIITIVYGVAIILPEEGQTQAVLDQVNNYVEQQQKAMENYLQDQYEIAKNAIVKQADSGEILLVMCKDAEDVMAKMEAGLAA